MHVKHDQNSCAHLIKDGRFQLPEHSSGRRSGMIVSADTGMLQMLHNLVKYAEGFPPHVLTTTLVEAFDSVRSCSDNRSRQRKSHGIDPIRGEELNVAAQTVLPQPENQGADAFSIHALGTARASFKEHARVCASQCMADSGGIANSASVRSVLVDAAMCLESCPVGTSYVEDVP
jgi:hypothetical protein